MKKILIGLKIFTLLLVGNNIDTNKMVTLPERVDGYGNIRNQITVSFYEAEHIINLENSKEKQPRNKCLINDETFYFDLSSNVKNESKHSKNHTYLGYGYYYLINGIKQVKSSKAHFWRDNTIPKDQSWVTKKR